LDQQLAHVRNIKQTDSVTRMEMLTFDTQGILNRHPITGKGSELCAD
jgi:hypothetical protein